MTPEQNRALPAHQETDPGYYPVVELAQGAFLPEQTQSNHQRRAWRSPDSRSERELRQINMVAWYARAFMTAEASLTKTTAFN